MMDYRPAADRYEQLSYRRCCRSGLRLPPISLGLWHNFGGVDSFETGRSIVRRAFDRGVTHFDLANNYGPPYGSAEEAMGRMLDLDLRPHRDELVISTKAGWDMWPGPYGDFGSRKYLLASLDQSLKRMRLEYVDIFYSHRPDPDTPLEETMGALDHAVRQGKALYAGISNYYDHDLAKRAIGILRDMGTPCLIHQPAYNKLRREVETNKMLPMQESEGVGCIVFSPLAQGLLTDRYLNGIPDDSRVAKPHGFLQKESLTPELLGRIRSLNDIAVARGQKLAQMALTWILRHSQVTSVLIGASKVSQIEDAVAAATAPPLSAEELSAIEKVLA